MQVTVETLEGLERRLNITVPAANIEDAVTAELRNIANLGRGGGRAPVDGAGYRYSTGRPRPRHAGAALCLWSDRKSVV